MPSVSDGRTLRFAVHGPIAPSDLPGLYDRLCRVLIASGPVLAECEVAGVIADATGVDALARLQLAARRHGCRLRLVGASPALRDLVAFLGLGDVLPG